MSLYGENLVCPNGERFVVRVTVRAVSVRAVSVPVR